MVESVNVGVDWIPSPVRQRAEGTVNDWVQELHFDVRIQRAKIFQRQSPRVRDYEVHGTAVVGVDSESGFKCRSRGPQVGSTIRDPSSRLAPRSVSFFPWAGASHFKQSF